MNWGLINLSFLDTVTGALSANVLVTTGSHRSQPDNFVIVIHPDAISNAIVSQVL
jgi:hypothetical protein